MNSTHRQHFTISRAIEYFAPRELEAQTGRSLHDFAPAVAPKELIDGRKQWSARRVELNAMSSTQLIAMIEQGLKEHGADHKLIPPDEVLLETAESDYTDLLEREIRREITRQLDIDAMAARVLDEVTARRPIRHRSRRIARVVASAFNPDHKKTARDRPWGDPLEDHVERHFRSAGLPRLITESVTATIRRVQRIHQRRVSR